ncbi:MAG TPA: ester cyclase [Anaeromyxobacter sp.]|nr:ester cyclase [Anaeromyxobacter sp.]
MAVDMKQSARRLLEEAYGKGNVEVFDELCDRGYRSHDPITGDSDLGQAKESCRMYREAFPDLKPTLLGCYADGDVVVTHWRMTGTHRGRLMGIEPTGQRCTAEGIGIDKVRAGRFVESWVQWDALGLLRQLGVAPAAQAGAGRAEAGQQPHAP